MAYRTRMFKFQEDNAPILLEFFREDLHETVEEIRLARTNGFQLLRVTNMEHHFDLA